MANPAPAMTEEQRINACETAIIQIYNILRSSPQQWRSATSIARTITTQLDSMTYMQQTNKTAEQVWMITALQTLASRDTDNTAVPDIAAWCSRQWLVIIQREPQNLAALKNVGFMWLARTQPALTRIHASQNRFQAASGSQRSGRSGKETAAEAERRVGTADYVEARGFLQPATEYLERAVSAAASQNALSGDLLAKVSEKYFERVRSLTKPIAQAAEAYMSLGNASSPRTNEAHYRRALHFLRQSSTIQGYALPRHLQK